MSINNSENSLLDFLKKKSLFSTSPSKNSRKRSRSRSKDSRNNLEQKTNLINSLQERSIPEQKKISPFRQDNTRNPLQKTPQPFNTLSDYSPKYQYNTPVQKLNLQSQSVPYYSNESVKSGDIQNGNLWAGLVSHASSFESARLQSSQCLQNLSVKIGTEISNINYKIDTFNSKMSKILNSEFKNLREKISQIFETAFKESDKYIKDYMKQKQTLMAGQLVKMRESLQKETVKIQGMKQQLNKPQWRKVAGQILASDLQHSIEEVIKKSSALQIAQWELGDISSYRIKNIQAQLKQIVRLKK